MLNVQSDNSQLPVHLIISRCACVASCYTSSSLHKRYKILNHQLICCWIKAAALNCKHLQILWEEIKHFTSFHTDYFCHVTQCLWSFVIINSLLMLTVSCDWQVRPAHPPCGTTTLGPISMATSQMQSLPSSSRTSSMPFSQRRASSPSWGTLSKGQRSYLVITPTGHMVQAHRLTLH